MFNICETLCKLLIWSNSVSELESHDVPFDNTIYLCKVGLSAVAEMKSKYFTKANVEPEMRVAVPVWDPALGITCGAQ